MKCMHLLFIGGCIIYMNRFIYLLLMHTLILRRSMPKYCGGGCDGCISVISEKERENKERESRYSQHE